jgi:sugar phosphate isomerase/epimerase
MILYGMGDPVEAVRVLMPHVRQVHVKDAVPAKRAGAWGEEVPAGTGAVDWKAFFGVLRDGGYAGNLVIEREAGEDRVGDVVKAVEMIRTLWR